ncbi:response regulator transcription factor [Bacillus mobilis]|uniref:DNA-binding response regulator n=2 Tax=Bacillus cereus group TaxID=86661 RepID=A0A1C4DWB9_BACCE|nr:MULTISPECIES: response regulator transcription factor [Bacillus cereus group]MCC2461375.1 response regulator transcription factor [Bacillus mobilis]MCU5435080.1 response regulator transcription factor [Bacillus mobilis]MCU5591202.1 response regulator transcription factor [Bacillus mobilis]MCU5738339.1 response regulator transcription factor [Bacillus mobilis]MCU9561088.1 response regulator transcription factor [Bacillus mobilis]
MRVLIVEDEQDLQNILVKRLNVEHYSVDSCGNGEDALDYINMATYDLIVLDIMIPGINGLQVLQRLRADNNITPVLLLTAKDTIDDRVTGLDLGADDYLVKPFAFDELLARIRVLMRRNTGNTSNVFEIADLVVDCNMHKVTRGDQVITLSSKEFAILEYMIRNKEVVLTRDKIEQHVWNYDYEGGSNIIDVYVRYLRKKIDSQFETKLIHTVRGTGYVLRVES